MQIADNLTVQGTLSATTLSGTITPSAGAGITAGTTRTQAGATALTKNVNRVDTSTAPAAGSTLGDGVSLQASSAGLENIVINNTANVIQVYGAGTDTINGVAATVGVPIPPGDVAIFECAIAGDWRFEAGVGASGRYELLLPVTGITAGTTRTQAGATALAAEFNRIDTSTAPAAGTTLGDGVILPVSVSGIDLEVVNNTLNPVQVYAQGTDTINGVAGATGVMLAPGAVETFFCIGAGAWFFDAGIGTSGQYDTVLSADNIAAAGTTQATAFQLGAVLNKVTTATALQGVKLPASAAGLDIIIENHTGVSIVVYGSGTDTIDDVATATGIQQMDSSVVIFTSYAPGKWYTNGAATGYARNPTNGVVLETVQYADGIAAAGTTQATATQMVAALNNVTTVAAGTGVNLPASAPGLSVIVQANGANPLTVYPFQGSADTINGIAATTGVQLLPGTIAAFNCTTTGAWSVQPGSTKDAAFNTNAAVASTTLTAANITGGIASVDLQMTGTLTGASNATLPTVAAMVVALHTPTVGTSFRLRITNASSGAFAWTVLTNTGWTLTGTMTINQSTWREFVVTLTSLTTATLQSVATGTFS